MYVSTKEIMKGIISALPTLSTTQCWTGSRTKLLDGVADEPDPSALVFSEGACSIGLDDSALQAWALCMISRWWRGLVA